MQTLCIIPCGNKKIWNIYPNAGPTGARDVYIGIFAKKCRQYAEKFHPSAWCILSAKYGFLMPDDIVPGPYNVSFNDKKTNHITVDELLNQIAQRKLNTYQKIVVLGGKNYVEIASKVFPSKKIFTPLSDCRGIGYMMGRLTKAIIKGICLA
jgi:hypothetical protein